MTIKNLNTLRRNTLVVATVLALSASAAMAAGNNAQPAPRVLLGALQSDTQFDRFIVKYRQGTPEANSVATLKNSLNEASVRAHQMIQSARLQSGARSKSAKPLAIAHFRRMTLGADVISASEKLDRASATILMQQIAANPNVEYVEVDRLNRATLTPNDTNYSQQWGYFNATAGIKANEAWDVNTGTGSVVAILDTGITSHSDLNANVLPGYDFIVDTAVSNDGNGRDSNPADPGDWTTAGQCYTGSAASGSSWHGTHVAGTVAAVTNNAKGVAGTAFNAKIVPVRVLGTCGGYDSDIADAMIWASGGTVSGIPANANPADVINLSLGGSGACGATSQAAINTAVANGTTLAIAAGNDNANVSGSSPANCANVVAVGSITSTGARSSFSNYGAGVDIAAPGSTINSTLNSGTQGPGTESYASYSGTSMATPHVAGVIALMQSRRAAVGSAAYTPAQVETSIKATARAFPATPSQPIGAGIINAKAAVDAAGGGGNIAPTANFSSSVSGLTATFTDSSTDSDGSIASRSWNFGDGTTSTATNPSKTYSSDGTYSVSLTVTDNGGLTNTVTKSVTVGTSGTVLTNGVAKTGLGAATGASLNYTMVVPAGATSLKFVTAGGTGDADMYVKFGSAPTDTVYDCRPYASGNAETCNIATAQAGTYYVRLKAYSTFAGVSLTGSYNTGTPVQTYTNTADYTINDNSTVDSPITVSGRTGNAPSTASVTVAIVHTYQGDLKVDLVAPDGSLYNIHNYTGAGTDNINKTVTLNLSTEALNGTWKLRVNDNAAGDVGYINSWSVTF
ncbi:MAG: S8 family serine peptidase [Arenimonas sp.]